MKKNLLIFWIVALTAPFILAGEGWLTSLSEAKTLAKKEGKPILMNFSGSDWCGWCIRLDKEVFSTSVFKDYAKDNLVLLELDFPKKTAQAEDIKTQNRQLADQYKVRGFPTIILIDADGKVILETGYKRGGSAAYVDHLKKAIQAS